MRVSRGERAILGGSAGPITRTGEPVFGAVRRKSSARRTVPPGMASRWTPISDPEAQPKSIVARVSAAGFTKHQSTEMSPATMMAGEEPGLGTAAVSPCWA